MSTPPPAIPPAIEVSEYAARREALANLLTEAHDSTISVVFAGPAGGHLDAVWRPHPHFEYLTGVTDEPEAVIVLAPKHPVESRRACLFLRPLNPELEQWDGLRMPVGQKLKSQTGFRVIHRLSRLGRHLNECLTHSRTLACLHPTAAFDQPVSRDLDLYRKVVERAPGTSIVDASGLIPSLRHAKSAAEIAQLRHAAQITGAGFAAVHAGLKPGLNEFDVQEMIEHGYRTNGSRMPGYSTIVGSGINSTVLHYRANDQTIADGDLICIDSGAAYRGYTADVTRTVPANGTFTPRQREIYSLVLKALDASIAAVKVGATFDELDRAARTIITDAGYGDAFIHSIGHHLGLEVHDDGGNGPLKEGAVITIEPGIYLPDEKIGVRLEDDIVVTSNGPENLTRFIPVTIDDVEAAMAGAN